MTWCYRLSAEAVIAEVRRGVDEETTTICRNGQYKASITGDQFE